jgi:hypothetical protein
MQALGTKMESALEIEYVIDEPTKILVTASNGYFSGYTEDYINKNWLVSLANDLRGFPTSLESKVDFYSKLTDPENSSLSLHFYCRDNKGHTSMKVCIRGTQNYKPSSEFASFELQFEASALDSFVQSILGMASSGEGKLRLTGIKNA